MIPDLSAQARQDAMRAIRAWRSAYRIGFIAGRVYRDAKDLVTDLGLVLFGIGLACAAAAILRLWGMR